MKRGVLFRLVVVAVLGVSAAGWSQNIVSNSTFGWGSLGPWTQFTIPGSTDPGLVFVYRTSALGLANPWDTRAAGTDIGTSSSGWRAGIYQTISGLSSGMTYDVRADGQILNGNCCGSDPSVGDDKLTLFWVDGTDTGFTTTWPSAAVTIAEVTSNVQAWTEMTGTITPTGTSIIIGAAAYFDDPSSTYAANSSLIDNVRIKPQGTNVWDVIFNGDVKPPVNPAGDGDALFTETDNALDQPVVAGNGAQVPVGSESFLKFLDDSTSETWDAVSPNHAFLPRPDGTMVLRLRRKTGYQAITGSVNVIAIGNGSNRVRYRIGENAGNLELNSDVSGGWVPIVIGPLDNWYTIRITWDETGGSTVFSVYVDGNLIDSQAAVNAGGILLNFNANNSATHEFDLDWLMMTCDGAFAPGTGPSLQPGMTEAVTFASDWEGYE